jgi:hypothetical protein
VKSEPRVLYLLRPDEKQPPAVLTQAAAVHVIRAGNEWDSAARQFSAQLLALRAPFDHEARTALEKLDTRHLPVIAFGCRESPGTADGLAAVISDSIGPEDLHTVCELIIAQAALSRLESAENAGPESGLCYSRGTGDTVRLLEHLLRLRLPEYPARTACVMEACMWIGCHLSLLPADLKELLWAARLREIGKLALPDKILFARREDRSAEEQSAYGRYPAMGARALAELPALAGTARIVECHLENFDGSGISGMMSHQIPLGSRILRVAGTFGAIAADRDSGAAEAIATLERGRGSQFDPLLVKLVANYSSTVHVATGGQPTQWVRLTDLALGMILAEDIWSRTGMKIVPAGTRISERILALLRQFPLDPSLEAVQIVS